MTKDQMKLIERLSEEYAARATHSSLGKPSVSFHAGATHPTLVEMYRAEGRVEAFNWSAFEFTKAATLTESPDEQQRNNYYVEVFYSKATQERERLAALLGEGE